MVELLCLAGGLLLLWLFYSLYWAPKRLYNHYFKLLTAKGYKVYAMPYNPFGAPAMQRILDDVKRFKDVHHSFRHILPGYEVVLTNISNHIELDIINPQLAQSMTNLDALATVHKDHQFLGLMMQQSPARLLYLEGQPWKQRRRTVASVFNFQFMTSHLPQIVALCRDALDRA